MAFVVAKTGLAIDSVWDMTPREIEHILDAKSIEYESKLRLQAETQRLQTLYLLNVQMAKKDQIKDPSKLWKLPWEMEVQQDKDVYMPQPEEWAFMDMHKFIKNSMSNGK